jgi:hypothetical protein
MLAMFDYGIQSKWIALAYKEEPLFQMYPAGHLASESEVDRYNQFATI